VITHPENALEMWAVITRPRIPVYEWEEPQDARVYRIVRKEERTSDNQSASESAEWWNDGRIQEDIFEPERVNRMDPYENSGTGPDEEGDSRHGVHPHTDGDQMQDFIDKLFGIADDTRPELKGKLVTHEQAILEEWERKMLDAYGLTEYSGSCFYFRVNSVSNQPRGLSDFLQVADWADSHDMTLFNLSDREQLASYFSWDVTMTGADDDRVKKRAKELRASPPKRGSVNVHNDAEVWQMQHPDIGAGNSIETARAIQLQVFGGIGYPEHWFGRGDETNRATAEAQGDPTWKTLRHDQGEARDMFMEMLLFVKDQAEIAATWQPEKDEETGEEIDNSIDVPMPEMTTKDTSTTASMLSSVASAIMVAEEQEWHDRNTSKEIWAKAVSEFGVEIEVTAEEQEEDEFDDEQGGDGAELSKEWLPQHGILLPDAQETSNWGELTAPNKQAVLDAFLETIGFDRERLPELAELMQER
jgi:hypothetical protein